MNVGWLMRRNAVSSRARDCKAIDVQDVQWAYRTILGRDPESAAVIQEWCTSDRDLKSMIETFLSSAECRALWRDRTSAEAGATRSVPRPSKEVPEESASNNDSSTPGLARPVLTPALWPDSLVEAIWGEAGLQETLLRSLPADKTDYPDGWATLLELRSLYSLALYCPGSVLEVGSWIGRSTTALCLGLRDRTLPRVLFDTVDFGHTGVDEWTRAFGKLPAREEDARRFLGPLEHPGGSIAVLIAKLRSNGLLQQVSSVVRGDFIEMPFHRSYALIFCDTTHSEAEVKRNVPKLVSRAAAGAVIVFDDVVTEKFAECIASYLPSHRRVLLHNYHQYSKYMLVKLES